MSQTKELQKKSTQTPMLKQYFSIKEKYPHCILFFRLGDFYEMFGEDAKVVTKELDLVLTARGKGTANEMPMCGFPHHSAEGYIAKLIQNGHKVAICEQTEDVSASKGIVKRDVTRVITSGTYLDENSIDARYILALFPDKKYIGAAFIDPSAGTIQTCEIPNQDNHIVSFIAKLPFTECIYPENQEDWIKKLFDQPLLKLKKITLSPCEAWCFNSELNHKGLCQHFGVSNLHGFALEDHPSMITSVGALLNYLKEMNQQPLDHINRISQYSDSEYVFISPAALHGLEIRHLIQAIDKTQTAMGKRLFQFWTIHPLKNISKIEERQNAVETLKTNRSVQDQLKIILNQCPDLERHLSRLSSGYLHPKDLLALRQGLALVPELIQILEDLKTDNALLQIEDILDLRSLLETAVNPDCPLSKYEGKIISEGYNKELDDLRNIQNKGSEWLKDLQQEESQRTGISSLKIGFNKVFGYYIEVTKTHLNSVPDDFIRKQTLANAERFITPKLKEYEDQILTAQDKILKLENELVQDIRSKILSKSNELLETCQAIAKIDCIFGLSILANQSKYVRPKVSNDKTLDIQQGRHPIVEHLSDVDFIPNDTLLDCNQNRLIILTGPNMAGKSTYIRQTAVLTIMAQMGSFIPAESANIGIVDKIFTRIGAHDDIARGQSTFMVEMNETADIINNLTDRSLVILDEIGRGTSTYDGLSLAWALAEHLHQTKARTLFATHFHELTTLSETHKGVKNYNVAVKEWDDEIIFLHKIIPGGTDDSYGIYVAKLAGVPQKVITRAKNILMKLELKDNASKLSENETKQLNLFADTNQINEQESEIQKILNDVDINETTPMKALEILNKLKKLN